MKKISKETNIATVILFLISIVATVVNSSLWWFILAVIIFYIGIVIMVNRMDKKFKKERKKRYRPLFDESDHYHNELTGSLTFKKPLTVNEKIQFDGSKINRCMLDEPGQWQESSLLSDLQMLCGCIYDITEKSQVEKVGSRLEDIIAKHFPKTNNHIPSPSKP